jgi:two-component system chemotaxis sensor kinase CheA
VEPAPTHMTSLRKKLVRTMVATLLVVASATVVVVAGLNYLSSRATLSIIEGHLRAGIARKGTELVSNQALALRDLVTDNAFGDVARLVERTLEQDDQVAYGLFMGADRRPWGYAARASTDGAAVPAEPWRELDPTGGAPMGAGVQTAQKTVRGLTVYEFAVSVVDDKGAFLGSLRYGLSDQPLRQAVERARAQSRRSLATTVVLLLVFGLLTSVLGVLRSRAAATRITHPLGVLTAAVNAFARGERATRVSIASKDEIEILGTAFNKMAAELEESYARLEIKVEERTRALGDRNRDMRLVLDHVDQGLLTVSLSGRLAAERSAIVDKWFGAPEAGSEGSFFGYVRRIDPRYAEELEVGLEALRDDVLPLELCLAQLPARMRYEGREYQCGYHAIAGTAGAVQGLLIVIKDVTVEVAHARQEADGKERLAMFNALAKDRLPFLAFVDEVNERLALLPNAPVEVQLRTLHTLKGNAALMGLGVLAALCHRLEDELVETRAPLGDVGLAALHRRWRELTDELRAMVGEKPRDLVELDREEMESLLAEIARGASSTYLHDRLTALALEPAERPLQRLGRHGQALASRRSKGDLRLEIDGSDVRLDPRRWEAVWADLVHVVRNAVDHGIESPEARLAAGKPARARLKLSTRLAAQALVIEIEDDGAGVDWEAVRASAARAKLAHETEADLIAALFSDGLTTRNEVTGMSGRGVGLAAVRRQVEQRRGTVQLTSRPGVGTSLRFSFPISEVGAAVAGVVRSGTKPTRLTAGG